MTHMKFGFELEGIVSRNDPITAYRQDYHNGDWLSRFGRALRCESDGSLHGRENEAGIEIVTRTFTLPTIRGVAAQLHKAAELSPSLRVNDTCGLHLSFSLPPSANADINSSFYFSLAKTLRREAIKLVPAMRRHYNRHYAKQLRGYQDYRKDRYAEFNLLNNNYVEWRAVHCQFLSELRGAALVSSIVRLVYMLGQMVERTVGAFFADPRDMVRLAFRNQLGQPRETTITAYIPEARGYVESGPMVIPSITDIPTSREIQYV